MSPKKPSYVKVTAEAFWDFLDQWYSDLPVISMKSLLREFPAEQTAILCVDLTNGFCKEGNLSSPRIAAIIEPIVQLFKTAEVEGINHYLLIQDAHPAASKEFTIYPPHCVENSEEAKTVRELTELSHSYKFKLLPKKTIAPGLESNLQDWLNENKAVKQFIVVGDCTDICVYQLAIFLKTWFIQRDEEAHVVVPANCVDTYDIPTESEKRGDAIPHPAEVIHPLFLYHMKSNGIRVVEGIK